MQKSKKCLAMILIIALLTSALGLSSIAFAEPGAVTGLTVKQSGTSGAALSWKAASGATKYQVNRSDSANGPWTRMKSVTGTSTVNSA